MKKIIFTLSLLVLALSAKAQNLICYSAKDVYNTLNEKGVITSQGYTEQNVYYITGTDNSSVKIYYFSSNNACAMYAVSHFGFNYVQVVEVLKLAGYVESGGVFLTNYYQASIVYLTEYKSYFIVIVAR